MKLVGAARITARRPRSPKPTRSRCCLDETGEKIQQLELREHSRDRRRPAPARSSMTARNIDLTYAPDGRTLQTLEADGERRHRAARRRRRPRRAGSRQRRSTSAMSPDGATVTSLDAQRERAGRSPGGRGRAGAADHARPRCARPARPGRVCRTPCSRAASTITETQAGRRQGRRPSIARPRRSDSIVDTKPGLRRRSSARTSAATRSFVDGETHRRGAARPLQHRQAISSICRRRQGEAGKGPIVNNPQLTVQALNIHAVAVDAEAHRRHRRSQHIKPQKPTASAAPPAPSADRAVPAMLKQDDPVNVTVQPARLRRRRPKRPTAATRCCGRIKSRIAADTIVLERHDRQSHGAGQGPHHDDARATNDPKTKRASRRRPSVTADDAGLRRRQAPRHLHRHRARRRRSCRVRRAT